MSAKIIPFPPKRKPFYGLIPLEDVTFLKTIEVTSMIIGFRGKILVVTKGETEYEISLTNQTLKALNAKKYLID